MVVEDMDQDTVVEDTDQDAEVVQDVEDIIMGVMVVVAGDTEVGDGLIGGFHIGGTVDGHSTLRRFILKQ
jgi:hypothetical protein